MSTVNSSDEEWMVDEGNEGETTIVMQEMAFVRPWKVLIVDDEPDVHSMTRLALRDMRYRDRPLELMSAYSAAEGYAMLAEHSDIALVLLDVVMETDNAGLILAGRIREELGNQLVRIVLRTGQPGQAPEEEVIVEYDINDYKSKTELTARKLFVMVVASLRTYESLLVIDCSRQGLRRILKGTENLYQYSSLQEFSSGVLSQVSAILEVGADGVFCAKRIRGKISDEDHGYEIVAGTGQYAQLPVLGKLSETHPFFPLIDKVFEMERNHYEHPYDVLHFATHNGYRFVLVFTPPWPLEDFQKDLLSVFCDRMASAFDNLFLYQQLRAANEATVIALADLAEYRDESTGAHIGRIKRMTSAIVARLEEQGKYREEITDVFKTMIGSAAVLHDVGKVSTPDHVLLKPGKHTPEEWEIMKEHAIHGESILARAAKMISGESYLSYGAQVAGSHHEQYDGNGYPRGLKGNDIPLGARIVAVADVFDALVHRRIYKDSWPVDKALAYMRRVSGTQFDPDILEAFLSVVEVNPENWIDHSER